MIKEARQALFTTLSQRLPSGEALSRQQLEDVDIPEPVRQLLLARMEHEAERLASEINGRRDPWISETADVRRARTAFAVAASRAVQIPASEVEDLLRETCDRVVRFLVRPARTLQEVAFDDDSDELDVSEVLHRIETLSAYAYFHEVLHHYFSERGIERIDRARLDSVLHRIDRQMTSDFSPNEWSDVLTPLFETLAYVPEYEAGVPVELLRAYFRDKESGAMLERLEARRPEEIVDRNGLVEMLERPVKKAESPPKPAPAAERESAKPAPVVPDASAPPLPLWKQFQQNPAAKPPEIRRPTKTPTSRPVPGQPLWQQYRATPAPEPEQAEPQQKVRTEEAPLEKVEREVLGPRGSRNRAMFVRQIFGGSRDAYRAALDQLSGAANWSEASQIIARDVFRRHDVNIYDDAAVSFTNMVEDRFAERHRI